MQIGSFKLKNNLILAPMAGVTDLPFRILCRKMGAGMAVSEMVASNSLLWGSEKTRRRADHSGEAEPRSVQIMGADPKMLADAAKFNVDNGAQIIDINMGCPAKKVCNVAAGSALLKDEKLVQEILNQVVNAVSVPVSLKIRTGWDRQNKNALQIAKIAESEGIQAIAIHGRTRADAYKGTAEYTSIAEVKNNITIPVIANGDIKTPQDAKRVLQITGADALMIGRAAQGKPWIFKEINHYLKHGTQLPQLGAFEISKILSEHLNNLYAFYGEKTGVLVARKHISWYSKGMNNAAEFRRQINSVKDTKSQLQIIADFLPSRHWQHE